MEAALREKKRTNPTSLPQYWRGWNLDLKNNVEYRVKAVQQRHITEAVKATIDGVLGDDNGWTCEVDMSLRDDWLQVGPGARTWCTYKVILTPSTKKAFCFNILIIV